MRTLNSKRTCDIFANLCFYLINITHTVIDPNFRILSIHISNGHNKLGQCLFSVQSRVFPKLKAKILQMRYHNVQALWLKVFVSFNNRKRHRNKIKNTQEINCVRNKI